MATAASAALSLAVIHVAVAAVAIVGSFRIDHSAGPPTVRFDSATCVGTITQEVPFRGDRRHPRPGRYVFQALYTAARVAGYCSWNMTGYTETIERVATIKA